MPPMYRECPFWYKRNYPQISATFTSSFRQPVGHTFALASYVNPVFERDGIHLTEDDGLKYALFNFLNISFAKTDYSYEMCLTFPSYVCHLIEEVYKFGESQLEPHLESCMNMQASHNEGVTQTLVDIQSTLAEVTVTQSEEKDGRLNERYQFIVLYLFCVFLITQSCLCSNRIIFSFSKE